MHTTSRQCSQPHPAGGRRRAGLRALAGALGDPVWLSHRFSRMQWKSIFQILQACRCGPMKGRGWETARAIIPLLSAAWSLRPAAHGSGMTSFQLAGSSLVRLLLPMSPGSLILSRVPFSLMLFCAVTRCTGLQPKSNLLYHVA